MISISLVCHGQPLNPLLKLSAHATERFVPITALTGIVPGSGQAVVVTLDDEGNLGQVGLLNTDE